MTTSTSKPKEHGRLFRGPMVRAILEGRKTETRRPIEPQPWHIESQAPVGTWCWSPKRQAVGLVPPELYAYDHDIWVAYPNYRPHLERFSPVRPGDRLWVRETFTYITLAENEWTGAADQRRRPDGVPVAMLYRADAEAEGWQIPAAWTPSIHMPRWASRIVLDLVDVRAARLHDMGEADAVREGISMREATLRCESPIALFRELWDSLYTDPALAREANRWVWVYEWSPYQEVTSE